MNPKSFKKESESEQKIDEEIFAILISSFGSYDFPHF